MNPQNCPNYLSFHWISFSIRLGLVCVLLSTGAVAQAQVFGAQSCGAYISKKLKQLRSTALIRKREDGKRLKLWKTRALFAVPHYWITESFRTQYAPGWILELPEVYYYALLILWLEEYGITYAMTGMSPSELKQLQERFAKIEMDETPILAFIELLLVLAKEGFRQQGMSTEDSEAQLAQARQGIVKQYHGYLDALKKKKRLITTWSDQEVKSAMEDFPIMFLDPVTWVPLAQSDLDERIKIQVARWVMQAHEDAMLDVFVFMETGQVNPLRYDEKYLKGMYIREMVEKLYQTDPPKVSKQYVESLLVIAIHLTAALKVRDYYEQQGLPVRFSTRAEHEQWVKRMLGLVYRRKAIEAEKQRRVEEAAATQQLPGEPK